MDGCVMVMVSFLLITKELVTFHRGYQQFRGSRASESVEFRLNAAGASASRRHPFRTEESRLTNALALHLSLLNRGVQVSNETESRPLWPLGPGDLPVARAVRQGVARPSPIESLPVDDPATGAVIGWCEPTTLDLLDEIVAAAAGAFPAWAAMPASDRAAAMLAGANAIEAQAGDLVSGLIGEVGKIRAEAEGDVRGGVALLRSFAALAEPAARIDDLTGREATGRADEVLVHRVPIGPVAVITPWNTPVFLTMNCVAPALAAGCTVVVKPADAAPLAVTAALQLLSAALPPGVLNVVQGTGTTTGTALCEHPAIRGVSFVGGTVAGRQVIRAAAATIKKVSLELGGNDPAIVLADARLDEAAYRELIAGCFSLSGQVCFNIKRIYVHRSRFDEFVTGFRRLVDQIVVGPAAHAEVQMGPLTTTPGYENALRLLSGLRGSAATVHEGGRFADGTDVGAGRFVRPTIVTGIDPGHELVVTEQFAPIIPILPFDTDDEAVSEANRTEYGLCSSVWSADPDHARAVALRIEAGNTFINAHRIGASVPLVPFGGFKQSGQGRNHMMHAIAECTEEHAIVRYSTPSEQIPGIQQWLPLTFDATESAS
jgi:aldehyde dehydrogenase